MSAISSRLGNALPARISAPQAIANELRSSIIEGRLRPGEPLRQDVLAKHFSVSRIPVREALRQLESEGWILFTPNKGATVSRMSPDEVRELYEIRAALECLAFKLAIPNHDAQSIAHAESLLQRALAEQDDLLYARRNEEFHTSLYAPSQRPQLLEMIHQQHRRGERYLRLKLVMPKLKKQSDREHQDLLEACRSKDVRLGELLLSRHLLQTGELLDHMLSKDGAMGYD